MKTVVLAIAGIGLGVLSVSGAVAAASALVVQSKPHAFASMDAPSGPPRRLSRSQQSDGSRHSGSARAAAGILGDRARRNGAAVRGAAGDVADSQCGARRLVRRALPVVQGADNTYRSYSGVLRTCQSPFGVAGETTIADAGAQLKTAFRRSHRTMQHPPGARRVTVPIAHPIIPTSPMAVPAALACRRRHGVDRRVVATQRQNCRALKKLLCARHGIQIRTELPGVVVLQDHKRLPAAFSRACPAR